MLLTIIDNRHSKGGSISIARFFVLEKSNLIFKSRWYRSLPHVRLRSNSHQNIRHSNMARKTKYVFCVENAAIIESLVVRERIKSEDSAI